MPVGIAAFGEALLAIAPVDPALRVDPNAANDRAWTLAAVVVGALVEGAAAMAAGASQDLQLHAGEWEGWLDARVPGRRRGRARGRRAGGRGVRGGGRRRRPAEGARLRDPDGGARRRAASCKLPIGELHPLRIAEAVARFGGRPADAASVAEHDEAVLSVLDPTPEIARPHEEADPSLRVARRMLQRLMGMGKWGGYHTEIAHLARGFAGHDRALALAIGERLVNADLLVEKTSVHQRHVRLNPRRVAEIHALVDRGELPPGLELPDA